MSRALTRDLPRTLGSPRRRGSRLGLGLALSTAVTGVVLAVPVVSSDSPTSTMSVDASSSSAARHAEESSPVVMGRDGAPASSPAVDTPVVPPAPEVPTAAPEVVATAEVPAATPEAATEIAPGTGTDTPASSSAPSSASSSSPSATAPSSTAAATSAAATSAAAAAPAPSAEAAVIALVNGERADAGCAPVVHDEGLARVARAHSADMRDRDFFGHVNPGGLDPFERAEAAGQTNARAENIAHGQPDPAEVMDEWMDSSGHRANILDCDLRTLGVGVAEGPDGPWWTQLFGS